MQRNEERLRNLWGNLEHSNIRIIGVQEREEEEQEMKTYLNKYEGKLPQSGKGERLSGSPGSPESPKEGGPKEKHTKAHHH